MSHIKLFLLLLLSSSILNAQVYTVDNGQTRHRFAQLLIGADVMSFPSSGQTYTFNSLGWQEPFTPKSALVPRINIAGTHFWGHANFYISIPLGNWSDATTSNGDEYDFAPGVETGLRIYPWRIERGQFRPFIGTALKVDGWQQDGPAGSGAYAYKSRPPLQAGLTFQHRSLLFDLGFGTHLNNELTYYVDRQNTTTIDLPNYYLWFGVNYQLETTLSAEREYRNGTTEQQTQEAAEGGALNGWSIAVGPSATFILGDAPRNELLYPALGRHYSTNIFPDFGLGYYYYPWDSHINLAYRSNGSSVSAYGQWQRIERRALTLEAYKFLFDYHGFVPFIGPHISREWLNIRERVDGQEVYNVDRQRWRYGITFGWDIRPNNLQGFILRTNLRYTPIGKIGSERGVSFNTLEFNFIQLVIYPGRLKRISRALKN